MKTIGESGSVDREAAEKFLSEFWKSNRRKLFPGQVFSIDKTGLLWEKLMNRRYISREGKNAFGFKNSKE